MLLVHGSGEGILNGGAPLHLIVLVGGGLLMILKIKIVVLALIIVEQELHGVPKDLVIDLWNFAHKIVALPFRHILQVNRLDFVAFDVVGPVSRISGCPVFNLLDLKLKKVS